MPPWISFGPGPSLEPILLQQAPRWPAIRFSAKSPACAVRSRFLAFRTESNVESCNEFKNAQRQCRESDSEQNLRRGPIHERGGDVSSPVVQPEGSPGTGDEPSPPRDIGLHESALASAPGNATLCQGNERREQPSPRHGASPN